MGDKSKRFHIVECDYSAHEQRIMEHLLPLFTKDPPYHIASIIDHINNSARAPLDRIIIAVKPRHAMSQMAEPGFALWGGNHKLTPHSWIIDDHLHYQHPDDLWASWAEGWPGQDLLGRSSTGRKPQRAAL